jgi:hypothetical protein
MLIKPEKRKDFCKGLRNIVRSPPLKPSSESTLPRGSFYFAAWSSIYRDLAMAALDFGFDVDVARKLLADSAWAYINLQRYTRDPSAVNMPEVLFRIGTCHDAPAGVAFCVAYLETREGRRGDRSPRGFNSPEPDDHHWHFANALALFHTGDTAGLAAALDELPALPPRKWRKYSDSWFKAMTRLAVHCLSAPTPDPWELLAEAAELNAKMFAVDIKDLHYDAWFAERLLAFACAAQQRGWTVPDRDPHPSMPLALLRLPPMRVPDYPWSEPPAPDPELVRAIERVAKGLAAKRPPGGSKDSGGGSAAKAAARAHPQHRQMRRTVRRVLPWDPCSAR